MNKAAMINKFTAIAKKSVKMTPAQARKAQLEKERHDREIALNVQLKKDLNLVEYYLSKVNSSRDRGIEFKLTLDQVRELVESPVCAYTGVKFEPTGPHCLTLERINPKLGYIDGNVVAVTSTANKHKSRLDSFMHCDVISDEMKLKLLRKAAYQLEKTMKGKRK